MTIMSAGIRWYVAVLSRAAAPDEVETRLEDAGAEVFCPRARVVRRVYDRRRRAPVLETAWVPLFGRYLFAATARNPGEIRSVRGVAGLVNNADGAPGTVPVKVIEDMKREYRDYRVALKLEEIALKPGQRVRIMEGPFRGYDATVKLVDAARGLLTAVREAMGREVELRVRVEDVAP